MKDRQRPLCRQFNLLLPQLAPLELAADKSQELVHALVELLISAAKETIAPSAARGDQDEPETDRCTIEPPRNRVRPPVFSTPR
jgi:hypothetical protein